MAKLQVMLPEPLKEYIDELVAEGTFRDPSDYVRSLIDRDRQARGKAGVEPLSVEEAGVLEGIRQGLEDMKSGRGRSADEVFEEIRRDFNIPRNA